MGHYRSEMGFEEEDRKAELREANRLDELTARIQAAIDQKGVARVLAEFIRQNSTGGFCYLDYRSRD
jgi:uncharacterized protein YeaO (DUF488 family)